MNYINDMQAFDHAFSYIRNKEAVDSIENIIDVMKRAHDKNNEIYSKLYSLTNQIDLYQHRIDVEKEYLLTLMELTSKINCEAKQDEDHQRMEENRKFNLLNKYQFFPYIFFQYKIRNQGSPKCFRRVQGRCQRTLQRVEQQRQEARSGCSNRVIRC